MKPFFIQIKGLHYLVTFIVTIILFVIEGARPTHHVLDSPLIYGDLGHIVLLILTFIIALYLGLQILIKSGYILLALFFSFM